MTAKTDEVIRILNVFGPLTERLIAARMQTPARGISVILRNMEREGSIKKVGPRWASISGPVDSTDRQIEARKSRSLEMRIVNERGVDYDEFSD